MYLFLLDFPGGSDGKASVYNAGDLGSIPESGRFPGEGNGNPLQYSCLENPMDGGAWCRLLSMGSQRVGHNWATSLSLYLVSLKSLFLNMALSYCLFSFVSAFSILYSISQGNSNWACSTFFIWEFINFFFTFERVLPDLDFLFGRNFFFYFSPLDIPGYSLQSFVEKSSAILLKISYM